jgi:hypothetical protein
MKTKQEILAALEVLNAEQQVEWILDLGMFLTVCARGGYPFQGSPGSIEHLRGLNEIQHDIYGCLRHLRIGDAWPLENFLEGLVGKARHYGVEIDFMWALKTTVDRVVSRSASSSDSPTA